MQVFTVKKQFLIKCTCPKKSHYVCEKERGHLKEILKIVFGNDPTGCPQWQGPLLGHHFSSCRMPLRKGSLNCCRATFIIEKITSVTSVQSRWNTFFSSGLVVRNLLPQVVSSLLQQNSLVTRDLHKLNMLQFLLLFHHSQK